MQPPAPQRSFEALRHPRYRGYFLVMAAAMMADSIEHVISYWVIFQRFHSPALGGFAVVSHWLPFLVLSVPVGALADRHDPRRLIQIGVLLFMLVSLGWGLLFVTGTLEIWSAMLLLVLHGIAGVLWNVSGQMLIHHLVPAGSLPSAVRLNATSRYLGLLAGPALGSVLMLLLGPVTGIFTNALIYVPALWWMQRLPPTRRMPAALPAPGLRGMGDILQTIRAISANRTIIAMILLGGSASFFIGNAYQAQMPGFAQDLGHGRVDISYSLLLAADAAGALLAGLILESRHLLVARVGSAYVLALIWAGALAAFSLCGSYALALPLLCLAGFVELSFNAMAQTLVQLNAPPALRGRVIGLFAMAALGLRGFSGVSVGLAGSWIGIHQSLLLSAGLLGLVLACGLTYSVRARG
jgi:MFS family permease